MLTAMNQAHYSIRQPVAVPHTPLYFVLMLHPLAQHLKDSYSTKLKKEIFLSFFSPHCYGCHLKPYFHLPLLAVNKVTTFSKGCLIKQSAVVTGPPRLLSGSSLHHCLRWWDLSCLFWNSIANMGLFLSRYAPSFPRKKKQHFHRGKRRQALWQEPAPVFRNDFSLAGST